MIIEQKPNKSASSDNLAEKKSATNLISDNSDGFFISDRLILGYQYK